VLSNTDLERELLLMTDRYTPELFGGIVDLGGLALVNNYSRLVFDPERFEDAEKEIMVSKGMGIVYTKTAYQQALRKELSAREREEMLSVYYRPYHAAVEMEVQKLLDQFERCLIIDCHSFPSKPLPYEFDQSTDRPDVCIGTNLFHTPKDLIARVKSFCDQNGALMAVDSPFAGTYVPLKYLEKDRRVFSIMVEVNRSLYMNEQTGDRSAEFSLTATLIDGLVREINAYRFLLGGEASDFL